ncbi:hypothetical protein BDV32DRAFT_116401 [Aspergillus pseudonomiae]|nr:hypothetical protein BDV32DRAFT_116401 [Aspergillus pseudonomiae]
MYLDVYVGGDLLEWGCWKAEPGLCWPFRAYLRCEGFRVLFTLRTLLYIYLTKYFCCCWGPFWRKV